MPVNFDRLTGDPDPVYMALVRALVDEVEQQRADIHAALEAEAGG